MAEPMAALRTLALRVEQAHPTKLFTEAGSPVNTALSLQAALNDEDSAAYLDVWSALACSPMFALAVADCAEDQRRLLAEGRMSALARRTALLRLATRMYLAGRLGAL